MNLSLKRINPSFRLAFIFLVFGFCWILLSDEAVARIGGTNVRLTQVLQSSKGIIFVLLSALLLFFSSRKLYHQLNNILNMQSAALQKISALNQVTGEGIIDYEFKTDTARVNEQMKLFLNTNKDVVQNFRATQQGNIHPSDRSRVMENFQAMMKQGTSLWHAEYRYKNPDHTYKDVISRGYLIRDPHTNEPLHMIYALQDVTALRDANSRYYEQQMHFRQALSQSILHAQEQERNRWAEELHDNVGQVLTAAKLSLDQLVTSGKVDVMLVRSRDLVQKGINDIRQLSSLIKSPFFSDTSLLEAVKELTATIERFQPLRFSVDIDPQTEKILSSDHKLMLYRLVQEQLTNILKYAEAKRVEIILAVNEAQGSLVIKDNGKGFDPEANKIGIGLKNIRSRLAVFSGTLAIQSQPGEGCRLTAQFLLSS